MVRTSILVWVASGHASFVQHIATALRPSCTQAPALCDKPTAVGIVSCGCDTSSCCIQAPSSCTTAVWAWSRTRAVVVAAVAGSAPGTCMCTVDWLHRLWQHDRWPALCATMPTLADHGTRVKFQLTAPLQRHSSLRTRTSLWLLG